MIVNNKLAFVFPGQGSQSVGMVKDLVTTRLIIKSIFAEASEAVGFDLLELVQNGPEEELNQTQNTQPAILTASYCMWRVWENSCTDKPYVMAGHSLGEFTALVCAGVLDFADAVSLVKDRGRYMQLAVAEGAGTMAAIIGLDTQQVLDICAQAADKQVVSAANFNTSQQVVISGHTEAVERAIDLARSAGAKRAIIVPVSVPSHCSLMEDVAKKFAERLDSVTFSEAKTPVIQNVTAEATKDAEAIKQALILQLHQPVRWVDCIEKMRSMDLTHIIECGPGKVLTGLTKRIDPELIALPMHDSDTLQFALGEIPWT